MALLCVMFFALVLGKGFALECYSCEDLGCPANETAQCSNLHDGMLQQCSSMQDATPVCFTFTSGLKIIKGDHSVQTTADVIEMKGCAQIHNGGITGRHCQPFRHIFSINSTETGSPIHLDFNGTICVCSEDGCNGLSTRSLAPAAQPSLCLLIALHVIVASLQ